MTLDEFIADRLGEDELCAWTSSPVVAGEDWIPPEQIGDVWEVVWDDAAVCRVEVVSRPEVAVPEVTRRPLRTLAAPWEDHPLFSVMSHVARHHPSRVTASVAGGRVLVAAFRAAAPGSERYEALHLALRALAVGHYTHPDFDPGWLLWSSEDSTTWPLD